MVYQGRVPDKAALWQGASPVAIPFAIAFWMNGAQIFERMTLNIGFRERKREILGKPFHRPSVINVCSAVECACRTLTEGENTILFFD
jgi:hypothetical protein